MPSLPFAHSRDACGGGTAKQVRESGPLDSVKRMGQTGGQEFCPDRKQTGTMVAAPNEERPEVEAAGRELK